VKTNGITDEIFSSVIITDGNNSISKSVGIYRWYKSIGDTVGIYRQNISVGIYRPDRWRPIKFVWKDVTVWWRGVFQMILPTEWLRDSNWDSRTVTWHFHRCNHLWKYRWIIPSVISSVKAIIYTPPLPTPSSSVSPSSSFPSHLSPPKLQPTTHPNSHKFLILCTWSQYLFLMDFIIFCK